MKIGDVQDFGWYGLMRFRRASVILHEDSQGFVDASVMSHEEAAQAWAELEADYQEFAGDEEEAD